jgi:hypothetical protein
MIVSGWPCISLRKGQYKQTWCINDNDSMLSEFVDIHVQLVRSLLMLCTRGGDFVVYRGLSISLTLPACWLLYKDRVLTEGDTINILR